MVKRLFSVILRELQIMLLELIYVELLESAAVEWQEVIVVVDIKALVRHEFFIAQRQ